MKKTIIASLAAVGGLALLTLKLLSPAVPPSGAGDETVREPVQAADETVKEPVRTADESVKKPVQTVVQPIKEPAQAADQPAVEIVETENEGKTEAFQQSWDKSHSVSLLLDDEVVTMPLDDYLTGVVLAEMPPSFELEALAAQAVAARTLVCRRLGAPKHDGAAVCAQFACCQAYFSEEAAQEKYGEDCSKWEAKAREAVEETDGLAIRYQGELIDAVYFSSAGGATEKAAAVWGGDVPYLQSVESPDAEERFTKETRIPIEEFRSVILQETPDAQLEGGPAGWFGAAYRTEGGGVERIKIGGVDYSGVSIRKLFSLRSTNFTVAVEGNDIVFVTRGNGHRVGMSQYGAQAMAQEGARFREILCHYYQGVEIAAEN